MSIIDTQILAKVELTNLLSINWNEQKIQTNFRLIVEALSKSSAETSSLRSDIDALKSEVAELLQRKPCSHKSLAPAPPVSGQSSTQQSTQGQAHSHQDPVNQNPVHKQGDATKQWVNSLLQAHRKNIDKELSELNERLRQAQKANQALASSGGSRNAIQQVNAIPSKSRIQRENQTSLQQNSNANGNNKKQASGNQFAISQKQRQLEEQIKQLKKLLGNLGNDLEDLKTQNTRTEAKINALSSGLDKKRTSVLKKPEEQGSRGSLTSNRDLGNGVSKSKARTTAQDHTADSELDTNLQQNLGRMEEQLNNLYLDSNTLRLCYEELKIMFADTKKATAKNDSAITNASNQLRNLSNAVLDERDQNAKQFQQIKNTLILLEKAPATPNNKTGAGKQGGQQSTAGREASENYNNYLNDKISKLQNLVLQAAPQTDVDRMREDYNNKIQALENRLLQTNKNLHTLENESRSRIQTLQKDLAALSEDVQNDREFVKNEIKEPLLARINATDKKTNVNASRIEELRKDLQYLKEDLEFYKNNLGKAETAQANPVQSEEAGLGGNSKGLEALRKKLEELRKQVGSKIHDVRSDLVSSIRDVERRLAGKNNNEQDISILFEKLGEVKLFLGKKADAEDTKKSLVYLEKKLSLALNSLDKENQEGQDARIGRKNWFCLSCDKVLQNYNGKVGKHVVWDALNTKTVMKSNNLLNVTGTISNSNTNVESQFLKKVNSNGSLPILGGGVKK